MRVVVTCQDARGLRGASGLSRAALVERQRELETSRADVAEFEHRDRDIDARATDALQRRRAALKERLGITGQRLVQRRTQAQNFDELVREGSASQTESVTAREALQAASETASALSADLAQLDLEVSCFAEVVRSLPHGLDTQLEARRANLSGGERQRLCTRCRTDFPALIQQRTVILVEHQQ